MLGVSSSYAYLLMKRGDIPTVRIGTAVRVRLEDLERYIREKASANCSPSRDVIHSTYRAFNRLPFLQERKPSNS